MTSSRLLLLLPPLLLLAACGEKDEDDGDDTAGDTDADTDGGFDDTSDPTRPDGGGGCEAIAVTEVSDPDTAYGDLSFTVAEVMRGRDGDLVGSWASSEDGAVPLALSVIPDGAPSLVEQAPAADTGWGDGTFEDTSYEETGPDSGERCPDYYDIPVRISWKAGDTDAPVLALGGTTSITAARLDSVSWSLAVGIDEVSGSFDPGFDPAEWDEVSLDLLASTGDPVGWRGDVSIQASRTDGDIGEGMVGLLGSFMAGPEGGPPGDSGAP